MFQPDAFVDSVGSTTVLEDTVLANKVVHMVADGIVVIRIRSAQADDLQPSSDPIISRSFPLRC